MGAATPALLLTQACMLCVLVCVLHYRPSRWLCRVTLQQHKVPYINASTITYSHPSLLQPCSYIAAQGPLPRTAADFWAMVLELQVPVVVMLTNCSEGGMVKCSQYFPEQLHGISRAGSFEVQVCGVLLLPLLGQGGRRVNREGRKTGRARSEECAEQ